jgi:hypothetical protein
MTNFGSTDDPGSDGDILSGLNPMTLPLIYEGPPPWDIPSTGLGGDNPGFCGTPPGPNDPLDCW